MIEEIAEKGNEVSINYWTREKLKDFNRLDVFHTGAEWIPAISGQSLGMEKSPRMKEQAAKDGLAYKNVIPFGAHAYMCSYYAGAGR